MSRGSVRISRLRTIRRWFVRLTWHRTCRNGRPRFAGLSPAVTSTSLLVRFRDWPGTGRALRDIGLRGHERVLVTGGAGFIGSNLVRALLEAGGEVRVLDNFSTGSRANLDGLDVEIVEGELRSYERVHNAVRGVEVVFHLGALGSVPRSVQDPLTSSAVNVEGTLNVLLAARDEGVRRVVFSSSHVRVRVEPRAADAGVEPARPDLALRRREARRRALLHLLLARLRVVRDGRAPLLQRLRPATEPARRSTRRSCRSSSRRSPPASR